MEIIGKVLVCVMILVLLSIALSCCGAIAEQNDEIQKLKIRIVVLETKMDIIYGTR